MARRFLETPRALASAASAASTSGGTLRRCTFTLVSRLVDSLAVAGDRFEDLLGGLGPDVRSWVPVPVIDPGADVFVERADGRMCAAAQQLGGQLSEPALDEVQPTAGR